MEPTTAIKAGTMVATGGLVADAVIFADTSYMYLAIAGAIVSAVGVIHDIYGTHHDSQQSMSTTIVEVLKGIALGILAIPFWYILLTGMGSQILNIHFQIKPDPSTYTSLSLMVAFALSWYTVPIFDSIARTIPELAGSFKDRVLNLIGYKGK